MAWGMLWCAVANAVAVAVRPWHTLLATGPRGAATALASSPLSRQFGPSYTHHDNSVHRTPTTTADALLALLADALLLSRPTPLYGTPRPPQALVAQQLLCLSGFVPTTPTAAAVLGGAADVLSPSLQRLPRQQQRQLLPPRSQRAERQQRWGSVLPSSVGERPKRRRFAPCVAGHGWTQILGELMQTSQ